MGERAVRLLGEGQLVDEDQIEGVRPVPAGQPVGGKTVVGELTVDGALGATAVLELLGRNATAVPAVDSN